MKVLRKISWLELKLFTREPVTVLFTPALPLLILYVLGGVFTDPAQPDEFRGVGWAELLRPGLCWPGHRLDRFDRAAGAHRRVPGTRGAAAVPGLGGAGCECVRRPVVRRVCGGHAQRPDAARVRPC
jgi:hypothetical protein